MALDRQTVRLAAAPDHSRPQGLRRRKSNRERVRVTRACDRCKRRKIKCNNRQPCEFCLRAKADCTFDSAYARGRKFNIPSLYGTEDVNDQHMITPGTSPSVPGQPYPALLPRAEASHGNPISLQSQSDAESASDLGPNTVEYVAGVSHNSLEPSQTDLQGHYIGPSSGVSFLLRVQKRLHEAISFSQPSSIFTFGDAPLQIPEFDPSFCMMLPKDDAQRLVDRYFDYAMPTYRFLHRPTIQEWFTEFYDTLGTMRDIQNAPARIALLFTVFSLARVYMPDHDRPGPPDLSARYFLAAEHQLTKEKGSIRLTSVQARLSQCYYLLTQSRINHCWSLSGTVSHLALAIGLNRNRCPDVTGGISQIESECRRRTFWCAYTLDVYLSTALGRPRSFHDEDIDTELPACIEDHELMTAPINTAAWSTKSPSTMLAPLAHMKIARIISRILRELYSIRPKSDARRTSAVKVISKDLSDWRAELAWFLDGDSIRTSLLIPIFQRQRNVLNLTYWNSVILTHRPFVLSNFAKLSQQDTGLCGYQLSQNEESVKQCLNAAMKTVAIIDEINENRQLFRALWITSYFAFNATTMLYIYVIQKRGFPADVYNSYYLAANRCQSHLSSIAERGSLLERYCLVLEELRVEATRQIKYPQYSVKSMGELVVSSQGNAIQPPLMPVTNSPSSATNYMEAIDEAELDFQGNFPGLSLSDCSGWDQFAYMVSSGLGNMDVPLNDGSFQIQESMLPHDTIA